MVDPIADMVTRIRNAQRVRKETVEVPFSKLKFEMGKILERTGYVKKVDLKTKRRQRFIELTFASKDGGPAVTGATRISKSGQRIYEPASHMRRGGKRRGLVIVSTSKGLMTAGEAFRQGLGGEILCEVW